MKKKTLASFGVVVILLVSLFSTVAAQSDNPTTPTPAPTGVSTTAPVTHSKFFTHPIVQILSAYFGRDAVSLEDPTATAEPTETATADPNLPTETVDPNAPTAEPTAAPSATPDPQDTLAEEIATYHENGMGFGVLVKLYAMAEAAKAACPTETAPVDGTTPVTTTSDGTTTDTTATTAPACTPVTVDQLVTEFKSGAGMGNLFKEYGKPALLGVGHVKHAKANVEATPDPTTLDGTTDDTTITSGTDDTTLTTDDTQTIKGNKHDKKNTFKTRVPKVKGPKK